MSCPRASSAALGTFKYGTSRGGKHCYSIGAVYVFTPGFTCAVQCSSKPSLSYMHYSQPVTLRTYLVLVSAATTTVPTEVLSDYPQSFQTVFFYIKLSHAAFLPCFFQFITHCRPFTRRYIGLVCLAASLFILQINKYRT